MKTGGFHQSLIVDLGENTGPVKHGAAGFLYGLGNDGIPSVNMLAPLKPQVAAQKPEGGRQHPNGDALQVSATYQAAGGREIEIYLQDTYLNWPYERLGLEDYLPRVVEMTRQVAAHPRHSLFSLVPFNEPDQIWYNKTDLRQALLADWMTVYRTIRSIYPAARIVGPNFANYDSDFYRDFLAFAAQNDCLPEVTSWHELNDRFFSGWWSRLADYREIEHSLGIPPREICINEYSRISGDLGNPGKLVQWIARFEHSKVDACLAYWTDAGSLNNLVTRNNYNKASGAWWLYRWYGGMSGHTLRVTPPDENTEGLQGLACLDLDQQQARILLGGSAGRIELDIQGIGAAPCFHKKVHASVWETAYTGIEPCGEPRLLFAGSIAVTNGAILLPVEDAVDTSAYQVILTPEKAIPPQRSGYYPAEYTDPLGSTKAQYLGAASPWVSGIAGSQAGLCFVINADQNAFYSLRLCLAPGAEHISPAGQSVRLVLNGAELTDLQITTAVEQEISVFLTAGINRVEFQDPTGEVKFAALEVGPGNGWCRTFEAESPLNSLSGTAALIEDPAASGSKYVGHFGNGEANALTFNQVEVPHNGLYRMVVTYASAEFRGGHSYNSQVVDRFAEISVNGGSPQKVYFRNTFAWNLFQTRVVDVELAAGNNTIRFFNSTGGAFAPHIDKIEIAAPVGQMV